MNEQASPSLDVPQLSQNRTLESHGSETGPRGQLLVRRLVRPGMTVFDVGTQLGHYTRLFSLAAGPTGRVIAFEAAPAAATGLAKCIREEKLANVELIQAAASQNTGVTAGNVPAVRLDEFCHIRGINRIDCLRLNAEGGELHALLGLEELLKRRAIGAIHFAVSGKSSAKLNPAAPILKLLELHGYECHGIGPAGEVGPKISDLQSPGENYIALPSGAVAAAPLAGIKFSFVTIVLNGMPFLEHALQAVYDFAHEIIIVEGAVASARFAARPDGSSQDGTVECIRNFPDPQKKIRLLQGAWPEKCEMHNAALAHVTGDFVWLMDSDEIYRRTDLAKVAGLLRADSSITQVNFIPDNFWKGFDHLMFSPFFCRPEAHYRRLFKFKPGAQFTTHRPPTLVWPGENRSTQQMNCLSGEITRAMEIIPFHYSYILETQVAQKIELYNRYGWGKGWRLDMNSWFRECWQAWTPENRQEIESRWPVWTGGRDSRTVPFNGEHPEVMKEYIAAFRRRAAVLPDNRLSANGHLPPSAKKLKVAEDYAREKDLTKIDGDSDFARAIRSLFKRHRPRRIIETGTYLGTGTTRVIAEALRDAGAADASFYSIEINPAHYARAAANLRAAGLASVVQLQRGLSVPRALLPNVAQIEASTVQQPEFDGIFVDHREANRARLYFAETNFADCADDLLGRILATFENRPDFVLLDSGGHMGFVEFQYLISKLAGPCLIGLDDIHHIKHHKSFQFMRRDSRFELLVESKEKFGFCIARFTPAAAPAEPVRQRDSAQRILWVRTDSIGDAILASSTLEPLRKKYPGAKLAVLCQQRVASLFTACPFVDSIICFDRKQMSVPAERQQIINEIAAFDPDVILNSMRSRDRLSDELTLAFGKARHIAIESDLSNLSAAERDAASRRYEQIIPSTHLPQAEMEWHAAFLRGLGIEASNLKPVVWTSPADEALAEAFFSQPNFDPAQTIAVFPGAQYQMRVYRHYAKALKHLDGFRFLIFGDASQTHLAEELERELPGRTMSLCGRSTLGETVALLRRCRLYVGAESAGAHIACAVGIPNVVVLGGGHFGRFMPSSPLTFAAVLPLDCFGCNWSCHFTHSHCVANLAPEVVTAAIVAALKGPGQKPVIFAQTGAAAKADATLPAVLAARLPSGAVDFVAVPGQPFSPLEPWKTGDRVTSIQQLIHLLDQGDEATRKLGHQLRIIAWQYQGLECYQSGRLGAAEAEAATLTSQVLPQFLPKLVPMAELDACTALVLGLAAEIQKDWRSAWACYSHALQRSPAGILGFRLAVRLARVAVQGGDATSADSLNREIIPKLRAMLPANLSAAVEEKAVLDWPPAAQPPSQPVQKTAPAMPLVTAIVSTFKSERFIRGCLEDLEAQTIADRLEIIVVDSHSPQNERAVVEEFQKRYSNIVYLRTGDRETVYGAWNRGVRAARGKYLTNANTDDRHRADALEILADTLDQHPSVSLAYADCLITANENETYDTGHPIGVYHWHDFNAQDLWTKGCFCGPQPMWRREVHNEHGHFDPQMITAGDYEFWLRLAQNRKFLHVHQTLGLYLKSPASVEHTNREVGAKEVELARNRYRDSIMAGKPPFLPKLPDPTAKVELMTGGEAWPATAPAQAASLPSVSRVGQLGEARQLFGQKNLEAAWNATLTAIAKRPFHPAAFLLLAEIALAAGAGRLAKQCARRARDFAPDWPPVKQFLCKPLKGDAKPAWLILPVGLSHEASDVRPRLSVCLIVKNEEQFLAQCLKSVRGLAAQTIVVDTGSTDRTVEIAREFGAEIYSFPWCDDFSAARNAALEPATGDWVLMLDADEELPAAQHAKLLVDMKNPTAIAYRLPLVNAGKEIEGRSFIPRLFRNAPEVFFQGRIHEQVFPSLLGSARKWGVHVALGSAEILHHGYTQELVRDRNKVERNLKLLRAAIAERPDANLLMNLGLELVRSDDLPGGIEKYREAFDLMSAQPSTEVAPELREVLLTQFTSQLYKVRGHAEVVRVLNSPLAQTGGLTASLHFALGLAYFELKQFSEAADQMRQCHSKRQKPGLTPINTDILTAAPQHCLALCLVKLGERPAAEKAFLAALKETGHVDAAQLDYARFLQNENRPLEALNRLHAIVSADARNLAAWSLGGEIALSGAEFLEFARDWTGEASQAFRDNPLIAAQRAEALMLNHDPAAAAQLWEKIWRSEPEPRALAALILCETAVGQIVHGPNSGPDEQATSRAFIEWYQRLIALRAKAQIETINGRLGQLTKILPTASQMLQAALSEAGAPVEV